MNRGDLEGRLDSYYYNEKFLQNEEKLHKIGFVKFHNFINIITKGSTPSMTNQGIPFLKVMNIDEFGFKTKKLDYISLETHNSMKRSQLHGNEILYSMAGTIGIALNYNYQFENANINQAISKIVLNDTTKNQLIVYLLNSNLCKLQAKRFLTVSAQPNINFEQIKSIKIPQLSKNKEIQIIHTMDNAYKLKKQKEQEAKDLLDGIDDYLLDKLGIELPKESDNNIESRTFRVEFSDVFNNRLDAPFYKKMYKDNLTNIKKSTFKPLKNIAMFSSETWNQTDMFTDTFPYVEISEINLIDGTIENINYIKLKDAPSRAKMIIRNNDIIVSTTRPARGAISLIQTDTKLIASTGFVVIRTIDEEVITKEYLFRILKSKYILMQFEQRSSGGNYPAITQDEMKKVIIPIPLLSLQNEITEYIENTLNKAKILQNEATEELKKAKEEVEKIILGKNYGT